jgi:hypothetical protein
VPDIIGFLQEETNTQPFHKGRYRQNVLLVETQILQAVHNINFRIDRRTRKRKRKHQGIIHPHIEFSRKLDVFVKVLANCHTSRLRRIHAQRTSFSIHNTICINREGERGAGIIRDAHSRRGSPGSSNRKSLVALC